MTAVLQNLKKQTNKSPYCKTNTPVSCFHLELRGVSLKNAVTAEKPQVLGSPCSQHLSGPGLLLPLPCEFNIASLLFFLPQTQHAFHYHFLVLISISLPSRSKYYWKFAAYTINTSPAPQENKMLV